jgi:O-antigen/teichoic acid export membrane protein
MPLHSNSSDGPDTKSSINLSGLVRNGMLWSLLSTSISKGASFGSQLVLGWLLSKEDFAIYAIAISWSTIVMALKNGGTQRLLIQKGSQYSDLASVYLKIAILFNSIGLVLLGIMAPIASTVYESKQLPTLIWVLALSLPIGSAANIFQAKLSSDFMFEKLARLTSWSALIRYTSMTAFAWGGLGPLSFVLPLLLIALFETGIGYMWAGGWPTNMRLTWPMVKDVLRDTRWVMVTALASALTLNGDYIAISLLQTKEVLGVYFFGFQLSLALVVLITNSVDSVMLPTFSRLNIDIPHQQAVFIKGVQFLTIGATFTCFALLISAQPLIHFLWGGKWDSSIPVVQLLSLSMPIRLVVPLCRSILEARGLWRVVSLLFIADGAGTVLAGAIGAWDGSLYKIVVVVSSYNLLFGLLYCGVAASILETPLKEIFTPIGFTFGIGLLAVTTCSAVGTLIQFDSMDMGQATMLFAVYAGTYVLLTRMFLRQCFSDVMNLVFRRITPSLG